MDGTEGGESIVTLTEAMQYRGLTAWKLAVERLRQITEILDGGALITEDGVEFELYGGKV